MKKTLFVALAFAFMLSMAMPLSAAELPKEVDKLAGGVVEILKSPTALYDSTMDEMDGADHKALGLLTGLVKAPFHMIHKAGMGAVDVATFPIE